MSVSCKSLIVFLTTAIACLLQPAQAQDKEFVFRNITINNGLSDNTITSICQDKQGFMWIGTHDGLNRYDGMNFQHFAADNNRGALPNNKILGLKLLENNKMGILTNDGFQVLNTSTYEARNYVIPDSTAFFTYLNKGWDVTEIAGKGYFFASASGFYWFNYDGAIVWRYDHHSLKDIGNVIRFGRKADALNRELVLFYGTSNYVPYILNTEGKRFLNQKEAEPHLQYLPNKIQHTWKSMVKLNGRVYETSPQSDTVYTYSPNEKNITASPLPLNKIELGWPSSLYAGTDSTLLLTCRLNGFVILKVDTTTGRINCDGKRILPTHACNYAFADKDGRLWIGTEKGIFVQQFCPPVIKQFPVPAENSTTAKPPNINSVFIFDSTMLLSGGNQMGIKQLNANTLALQKTIYLHPDKNSEWNKVLFVAKHTKDTAWVGSRMGLGWLHLDNGKTGLYGGRLAEEKVVMFTNCFSDAHKNTWFSARGASGLNLVRHIEKDKVFEFIHYKKPPYYLPLKNVDHFTEDVYGDVWVAGTGLARFNVKKQVFDTALTAFPGPRKHEPNILGLTADNRGNLWIATVQNGLLQYTIKTNTYKHYSVKEGISSDFILALYRYDDEHILIVTRNKLNILNIISGHISVYSQSDGLPESSITTEIYQDSVRNILWAGYHDMIAAIPKISKQQPRYLPRLTIEYLETNRSTHYFPQEAVKLGYKENNIIVALSALNYEVEDNSILYYRMNNNNDPWRSTERSHFIYLDNLLPGEYKLELMLHSVAGRWPAQFNSLAITIAPPFWRTWWFTGIIILLIAVAAALLYRHRIKILREKANRDKMLAELEMKALHTEMNPHFIFNCLNSIKEMILNNEKDKASRYLSTFALLLRDTLEHSTQQFISLENTILHIERYISIEKLRFSNFIYHIDVDPLLDKKEVRVPPMLLQPLIENAIWHGLQPLKHTKTLVISFRKEDHNLVCSVDDNGIGIHLALQNNKGKKHHSVAIENINKRIALLNEKFLLDYRLSITDKSTIPGGGDQGTIATLIIPLNSD